MNRVIEVPNGKEKPSLLVYFSYLIKMIFVDSGARKSF